VARDFPLLADTSGQRWQMHGKRLVHNELNGALMSATACKRINLVSLSEASRACPLPPPSALLGTAQSNSTTYADGLRRTQGRDSAVTCTLGT
jgi:hypothetical protein